MLDSRGATQPQTHEFGDSLSLCRQRQWGFCRTTGSVAAAIGGRARIQRPVTPGSHNRQFVLRYADVEFHRSAFKHGYDEAAINHAVDNAPVVIDLEAESYPPKVLAIGPDPAGNVLEVIWLELDEVAS
ncbi:MAG: hypothetical protein ACI8TP_003054 [Acidimicrobiales bacterium]